MKKMLITLTILAVLVPAGMALAGAIIPIGDEAQLNFGFRVQVLGLATQANLDEADDEYESITGWAVRRARFRLGAKVGEHMTAFLQTDASGKDMKMIDAWVNFQTSKWLQFIGGRNMAPASRQNLTSSGALMAIDRPGSAYKSLTWGARARHTFTTRTFGQADAEISAPDAVRDLGLTLFGSGKVGEQGNLKYYAGIYNGVQEDGAFNDKDRLTFRGQYNLWDAEAGYFNSSTYLGKKKTLGIGFSYDTQKEVATTVGEDLPNADYTYMSADLFLELPTEGGAFTFEGGWMSLDFNDAADYLEDQGSGFYTQAGYFLNSGWQPWVEYESFGADAELDVGNYTNFRIGVNYYLEGQNANIKLGYESFMADVPFADSNETEDTINSYVLGFYTTY